MPFKPYHASLQLFIHSLLFLGLISRSCTTRFVLLLLILTTAAYTFFYTRTEGIDQGPWVQLIVTLLQASDVLAINDVTKLRLVGQMKDANQLELWERTKWALKLLCSPRHIGWTHEPRYVFPPHPTETRWWFVCTRVVRCWGYYIIFDVLNIYMCQYYVVAKNRPAPISEGGVWKRILMTGLYAAHLWSYLSLAYTAVSIVSVAGYLTEPNEWPALFGSWRDAYTVRRFWGRTWHQTFRRIFTTHANFIAYTLLWFKKDTILGPVIQYYAAFAISGLFHTASEYGAFRSDYWGIKTGMTFFLLQPTVITIEQTVAKFLGLKATTWTRRLGYVWVICWFAWTAPAWFDRVREHWIAGNDACRKGLTDYLLGLL